MREVVGGIFWCIVAIIVVFAVITMTQSRTRRKMSGNEAPVKPGDLIDNEDGGIPFIDVIDPKKKKKETLHYV